MIQGILLAAGKSQRFGSNKLEAVLPNQKPVALQSALSLKQVVENTVVVTSEEQQALINLFEEHSIETFVSGNSHLGIGHTISDAILHTKDASGWMIMLADMPFISLSTIQVIRQAMNGGAEICVPYHNGRQGHPVGFSQKYRDYLVQLSGDKGAKSILKKFSDKVSVIDVEDENILKDIDYRDDLPIT